MATQSVHEYIIDTLTQGSLPSTKVVEGAIKKLSVTKEAVYKALRHMITEEIVVKRGKTVSLSNQWVITMAEKWNRVAVRYSGKPASYLPAEKNSIVYTCKTLDQLDTLWNHNIYELITALPAGSCILSGVPHYWFPAIREKSEHTLMKNMKKRGFHWLQLISNAKKLDVEFLRYFPYKEIEYHATDIADKNYFNVFGEYVVEVTLEKKASDYISRWYSTHAKYDAESITELEKVLRIKGVYKLKISRNKAKADRYRKLFKKYFLIK